MYQSESLELRKLQPVYHLLIKVFTSCHKCGFHKAPVDCKRSDGRQTEERRATAILRDLFFLRKFTVDVNCILTSEQEKQDRRRSAKI